MKKILTFASLFFICFATAKSEKSTIIHDILNDYVVQKVDEMQQIIKFSDTQAEQLKKLELRFLLDVQKAENCCFCNPQKRVDKLRAKKYLAAEKILPKYQFIQYKAIDNKEVKRHPEIAE